MTPLVDATKICRVCKEEKVLKSFSPNKQCKFGVTGTCRDCENSRVTQWYRNNRKRRQQAANNRNQIRKRLVVDHFGDRCGDCQQTYPQYVYEFHHLDPKSKDMNPSAAMTLAAHKMWGEIDKCVMLCANCHKIRHWSPGEKVGEQ